MTPTHDRVAPERSAEVYLDAVLSIWAERRVRTACILTGDSMAPFLKDGDRLVIEHGNDDLHVGDVIIFATPERLLAHRLVRRRKTRHGKAMLWTKGDGSRTVDRPIRLDQVIGRVVEVQGPTGRRRLTSGFRLAANYLLAVRSVLPVLLDKVRRVARSVLPRRARAPHSDDGGRRT